MEQRKLYRTLENLIKHSPNFESEKQMLSYILKEIINHEDINITGGRIWELSENKTFYTMTEQHGAVEKIKKGYMQKTTDYGIYYELGRNRSVLAKETDRYLYEKGINLFAATGVGDRYKVTDKEGKEQYVYQYIIAINSIDLTPSLLNTLNIISTTVSSMLRTRRIEKKARAIEKDLEKAREIQKSILPEHEYKFGNYEIFGISIPDRIVGGDFFDYIRSASDSDRLGIAIGDAASKGFSAAAQALYVSGALKMGTENELKMSSVIKKINNLVYKVFPYERFVTLFYLEVYKDNRGLCMYINAGHNSPFFLNASRNEIVPIVSTGPVLGPAPDQDYMMDSFNFHTRDILVMYTDGIIEATNNKFEFYGEQRLKDVIMANKTLPAKEIAETVIEDVQKYSAKGKYSDDRTVVVIKRIK